MSKINWRYEIEVAKTIAVVVIGLAGIVGWLALSIMFLVQGNAPGLFSCLIAAVFSLIRALKVSDAQQMVQIG